MKKIEIFDPAMCCSTGVCGPSIDPELLRLSTVLNNLKGRGINISRYGLAAEPQAFVANKVVSELLQQGAEVLPVTLVDGHVVKQGTYPTNEELAAWLGLDVSELRPQQEKKSGGCCCGPKGCC